jgi:leucyl aminopeptidase
VFSNNDDLANNLIAAGQASGDMVWRMPLPAAYEKQIESMAADMKNVGGRPGGSITAALFLQKFVAGLPWAHLDIAGVAWKKPSSFPTMPEGATGFGVRLLDQLVTDFYEG